MKKITTRNLLNRYKKWVNNDNISFLKTKKDKQDVTEQINSLIESLPRGTDYFDWNKVHEIGKELWNKLCSCALNNIDQEAKGNSKLYEFLNASTEFEDLLYGLEPYYRDHTLHSLWVYFIGEHLMRDLLPYRHNNLNWYLYNDIESEKSKYSYKKEIVEFAKSTENSINDDVNQYKDAIWCVMALCHDLGYSLEKLSELNKKVAEVLKFFDIPDFRNIGYSLDIEHQHLISQFLELMAMDVRIVPSENYHEEKIDYKERVLTKSYRDDRTYWLLCRALEKRQHGILSAYLIYKVLGIFADSWVRGPAEQWGLDDEESVDNIIRGDILFAIAQHGFDFAHLNQISSLADILVLADELEEFSRFGRQLLTRRYNPTMAETTIAFVPNNPKQNEDIEIDITYHSKHRTFKDFADFFIRKAERIAKTYCLERGRGKDKCTIKSIKMTAKKDGEKLFFYLCRDSKKTKGYFPKILLDKTRLKKGPHKLICYDDKIFYVNRKGERFSLSDLFANTTDKKWVNKLVK